eukprot:15397933-Alexandrium_andersonii.AAC.1
MFGYPYLLLLLIHPSSNISAYGLRKAKEASGAWEACQALQTPFWRRMNAECCMNQPVVKEIFHELKRANFEVGDALKLLLGRVARGLSTSALTERGFQACRAVENEDPNRKLGPLQMWNK